jgi:protein-disulfide isomerase
MTRMIARLALALTLTLLTLPLGAQAQQFGPAQFAIRADDGVLMSNHRISAEQAAQVVRLPGIVTVGNPQGDVTLVQFYDLNCAFCRKAAREIDELMRTDRGLKMIFVPYPTLSMQSVEGARVELAVRELVTPQRWLEFRKQIYAGRGTIDGARALAVTQDMGLDEAKIIEIANAQRVTEIMKAHAQLGTALKMAATPSYVLQGVAIMGHPGLAPLRKLVRAVRTCGQVVC